MSHLDAGANKVNVTRHDILVKNYAEELRAARTLAERWWADLIAVTGQQIGSPELAERLVRNQWPDGPASHPRVLTVIRKYWLACETLNEQIEREGLPRPQPPEPEYVLAFDEEPDEANEEDEEEEREVYPHVFILEWLMTEEFDDLADFVGTLSYWPIGLNADEHYT
jgi:hypothetical protein